MKSESGLIVASEVVQVTEANNSNDMEAVACKRALHSACKLGYNIETLATNCNRSINPIVR